MPPFNVLSALEATVSQTPVPVSFVVPSSSKLSTIRPTPGAIEYAAPIILKSSVPVFNEPPVKVISLTE